MNAARRGLTSYRGVVKDFLSFGIANTLAGRKTYNEGTGFRLADHAGRDLFVKSGPYCEAPPPAGKPRTLPVWPYPPPNLPFAGACP